MRYGLSLPNIGEYGDPTMLVELAGEAEQAGWDGVFVWDCIHLEIAEEQRLPICDPWIALAAIAATTSRVRLGPTVTPRARRRPWKVAREIVTLDHLAHGRAILPIGYGAIDDGAFCKVGEDTDVRVRAQKVDEGLEILAGLVSGERFNYHGHHYQVQEMTFLPRSVQFPRVPIWVDALWPRMRSMRRAINYDGLLAGKRNKGGSAEPMTPDDIRAMKTWIDEHRTGLGPFDIIHEGTIPGHDQEQAREIAQPWEDAGVTWWIEAIWNHFYQGTPESMRTQIRHGPPIGTSAGRS